MDKKPKVIANYETKISCKNCRNEIEVTIPIGVTVIEWKKKNSCNICKCALK